MAERYAMMPESVLHDETLSPTAKSLYAELDLRGGRTGECYASVDQLAASIGRSPSRTKAARLELERAELVTVGRRRFTQSGPRMANTYHLVNPARGGAPKPKPEPMLCEITWRPSIEPAGRPCLMCKRPMGEHLERKSEA